MGTVVHVEVVTEERDADLRLGEMDSEDGLAMAVEAGATMPERVRVVLWTAKEYEAFRTVFAADPRFVAEPSSRPSTSSTRQTT